MNPIERAWAWVTKLIGSAKLSLNIWRALRALLPLLDGREWAGFPISAAVAEPGEPPADLGESEGEPIEEEGPADTDPEDGAGKRSRKEEEESEGILPQGAPFAASVRGPLDESEDEG